MEVIPPPNKKYDPVLKRNRAFFNAKEKKMTKEEKNIIELKRAVEAHSRKVNSADEAILKIQKKLLEKRRHHV